MDGFMTTRNILFSQKDSCYNSVRTDLKKALFQIRSRDPNTVYDPARALSSDIRIGYLHGRPVERLVITLRSAGCGWVRRGGGCTMCGHYPGTTRGEPLRPLDFLRQFQKEMAFYRDRNVPVLCLYNSGSMLNEEEIPGEALAGILDMVARKEGIKKVVLESRPEYCSKEKIRWIRKQLGPKRLEIAMGLESSNDQILALTLNKGFASEEFRSMVEEIKEYVPVRIYILLKGPFLTEREAVEDAVSSIRFARTLSPREIHLEPATLQEHSLLHSLHGAGHYRLPWLWSIYEVLRRVGRECRVYVSPFSHMPRPYRIPENCRVCTGTIQDLLTRHYNRTFDLSPLHGYSCTCRSEWEEALLEEDPRPLAVRVIQGLEAIRAAEAVEKRV
jgi:hypothetical protein